MPTIELKSSKRGLAFYGFKMPRQIIIGSLAVVLTLLFHTAFAETDGFRGITWETDISTLTDMKYVRTDLTGIKRYARKSDELKIGAAELEGIEYGFWQDKFCDVLIWFQGYANFSALKDATFEKLGDDGFKLQSEARYAWLGEVTLLQLEYDDISGKGTLFINSKKIFEEQKRANP